MVRTALFGLVIMVSGGCASPDLGRVYDDDVDGAVLEGGSRTVIYVDDAIDPAIFFSVNIDGEAFGRLFPGTFTHADVGPGAHVLTATEMWTGKGLGKGLGQVIIKPFSEPDDPWPEELSPGAKTTFEISMAPADVTYIRISKALDGVEVFYPCAATRDTTTMCPGKTYPTEIQEVSVIDAREELQNFKESL